MIGTITIFSEKEKSFDKLVAALKKEGWEIIESNMKHKMLVDKE